MGGSYGTDPEEMTDTQLFIMWGVNGVSTNMHQMIIAQKARKNGAKIVVIDVHKNQTGRMADWFIPIMPGTDGRLHWESCTFSLKKTSGSSLFRRVHNWISKAGRSP